MSVRENIPSRKILLWKNFCHQVSWDIISLVLREQGLLSSFDVIKSLPRGIFVKSSNDAFCRWLCFSMIRRPYWNRAHWLWYFLSTIFKFFSGILHFWKASHEKSLVCPSLGNLFLISQFFCQPYCCMLVNQRWANSVHWYNTCKQEIKPGS